MTPDLGLSPADISSHCACPSCSGELGIDGAGMAGAGTGAPAISCTVCGTRYPVRNGIPELLAAGETPSRGSESTVRELARLYDAGTEKYDGSPKSCGYATDASFKHRLNIFNRWVDLPSLANLSILDIGCGTGLMSESLVSENMVWGVDISAGLLGKAREKGIRTVLGSADALPFQDGVFDLVVCMGVLPYYTDPDAICRQIARVTRPSGRIVVTATTNSWLIRSVRYVKNRLWMKSQLKRLYTPRDLARAVERQGIRVKDNCMGYNDRIVSSPDFRYPLRFRMMARVAAVFGERPG